MQPQTPTNAHTHINSYRYRKRGSHSVPSHIHSHTENGVVSSQSVPLYIHTYTNNKRGKLSVPSHIHTYTNRERGRQSVPPSDLPALSFDSGAVSGGESPCWWRGVIPSARLSLLWRR